MTAPQPSAALLAGRPIARVDGRLKVTGKALYAADNPVDDLVHAVLVCSTVGRGSVEGFDTEAAQDLPDVLRVLTEFSGVTLPFDMRQVAFFGQPVAVVVANTLEAATHGVEVVADRRLNFGQPFGSEQLPMPVPVALRQNLAYESLQFFSQRLAKNLVDSHL